MVSDLYAVALIELSRVIPLNTPEYLNNVKESLNF